MNTPAPVVHVLFYAGPLDGLEKVFAFAPQVFEGPGPGGRKKHKYQLSAAWSAHFDRPTMVPEGFTGLPPAPELQTA